MKFVVEKANVDGHVPNSIPPPYQHGHFYFQFSDEKRLSPYYVISEFSVSCLFLIDVSEKITHIQFLLNFFFFFVDS